MVGRICGTEVLSMEWKSQGVEENEGDELTRDENEAQPPED